MKTRNVLGAICLWVLAILIAVGFFLWFQAGVNIQTAIAMSAIIWCLIFARRMVTTRGVLESVIKSSDPIILYLRSFALETQGYSRGIRLSPFSVLKSPFTYEQRLSFVFARAGRFIAVARPGEPFPELGGERIDIPNEKWQDTVLELMHTAKLVVIGLGSGKGLEWEIKKAVEVVDPERLLLFIPPPELSSDPSSKEILEAVRVLIPCEIPAEAATGLFIHFENGWHAKSVGAAAPRLQRILAFGTWDAVTDALGRLLAQRSFGVKMPRLWLGNPKIRRALLIGVILGWSLVIALIFWASWPTGQ